METTKARHHNLTQTGIPPALKGIYEMTKNRLTNIDLVVPSS